MERIAEWGLANALTVLALAPLAALVGRWAKRPAWAHAAWLLVLLKFVTPPIASLPIVPRWEARIEPAPPVAPSPAAKDREAELRAELRGLMAEARAARAERVPARRPRVAISWRSAVAWAWLAGSASWLMLAGWRIARFARVLGRANPAPEDLIERVDGLSERIGLRRPPIVAMVAGRVSPMVWSPGGRARLVVPEGLWDRLDEAQRSALIVHELAHLRRGDHLTRWLEMVVTGLYWWHPVSWWARRGLHRAEESCCDLWVVWALPKAKKPYATALVEAVDFLSEDRARPLPACASGMGQVEDLSRRIGMIMRNDAPRGLSRAGALATFGLAVVLLPWQPSWARQDPAPAPAPATDEAAKPDEFVPEIPEHAEAEVRRAYRGDFEAGRRAAAIDQQRLQVQLAEVRARDDSRDPATDAKVQEARARLAELEAEDRALWAKSYPDLVRKVFPDRTPPGPDQVGRLEKELKNARNRLNWAEQIVGDKPGPIPGLEIQRGAVLRLEHQLRMARGGADPAGEGEGEDARGEGDEEAIQEAFLDDPRVDAIRREIDDTERAYERAKARIRGNLDDPTLRTMREKIATLRGEHDGLWQETYAKIKEATAEARAEAARRNQVTLAERIARDIRQEPTSAASRLRQELKRAEDRYDWSRKMLEQKYVPRAQVEADRHAVDEARAKIRDEQAAKERGEADTRAEADLARSRVALRKAGLKKAEAQRQGVLADLDRLKRLAERGEGFVSRSELIKAEAAMAEAEAAVEEARARVDEEEILARRAAERVEVSGPRPGAGSGANPPDAARRIEELESKMDRILKELEALRAEKAEKPQEG